MSHALYPEERIKPLFYYTYFFLKSTAVSASIGAVIGRVFKWYTPSHAAMMGAFFGATKFPAVHLLLHQCAKINRKQFEEGNGNPAPKEDVCSLINTTFLAIFACALSPLAVKFFKKPTDLRLLLHFHCSSSVFGLLAFSKITTTFCRSIDKNGRGTWWEHWAEEEWLTRPSPPSIDAKIRWENFTRHPKALKREDTTLLPTINDWANLCAMNNVPSAMLLKTLNAMQQDTSEEYRYLENLLAQLYHKLATEKNNHTRKQTLLFLENKLSTCVLQWFDSIYKVIYETFEYHKFNSLEVKKADILQWALTIDQEIREGILKNKISDFEPKVQTSVHHYEIAKKELAREKIFAPPGGVDGYALFQRAHPATNPPLISFSQQIRDSRTYWTMAFKHRYDAKTLHTVFKQKINDFMSHSISKVPHRLASLQSSLGDAVRNLLGINNISLKQAEQLVRSEFFDHPEGEHNPTFNDAGTFFFLQVCGFFELEDGIVPGKSNEELLAHYIPN
ncbi:MAG: hypothetical protein JSR80_04570 [Verrucomicrobia bacterium]|nr:hypothetical protein [Verrucomicrobiota bacterium]